VVTIFFCETAAKIRRNDAIAPDIQISIDGGISFSDDAADERSRATRLRLMLRSRCWRRVKQIRRHASRAPARDDRGL